MTFRDAAAYDHPPFSTDECLKCNVCTTVCPVARVTDLFPGPKYVGPQAQRFRAGNGTPLRRSPDVTVDWCSGCGICTRACPAGVLIAETNNRARAAIVAERGSGLRNRFISDTDLLARFGVPFAPIANVTIRNRFFRIGLEKLGGIHRRAPIHPFARRTFRRRWRGTKGWTPPAERIGPEWSVVYYTGCAANAWEPEVAEAAVEVLERNGFDVIVASGQVCCGLPFISNGLYDHARRKARQNIHALASYAQHGYRIVGTSTSCTHALKAEYREMLDLDDPPARAVADATWDIMELLADLHEQGRLNTDFGPIPGPLPYHPPCQLRSHGIGTPALDLFALVPGLGAYDCDHDCCGAAGTYGLKREKWQIAQDVGQPLFDRIRAAGSAGASQAACDSETCRWQIEASTGVRTRHPVEVLADSYRAFGRVDAAD
ncbi:MAG: anaerobic glycerol-3-phosphate dehydrogenase subunit C [Candidatus Limnocylindria bacterium]